MSWDGIKIGGLIVGLVLTGVEIVIAYRRGKYKEYVANEPHRKIGPGGGCQSDGASQQGESGRARDASGDLGERRR